jgi:AcrR family transcriptional regulator
MSGLSVESSTVASERPLRADALRNRNRIVDVATAAFTDESVDVALEEIARRAGVGIGTLYRHFPTRESLVLAVYQSLVDDLRTASVELPNRYAPAEALHEWMRSFVRYAAVKRGMVALLRSVMETDSKAFDATRDIVRAAAQSLIDPAVANGSIRGHVNAPELIRAIGGICMVTDRPGNDETAMALVDLVFDGLRYGAPAGA